MKEPEPVIHLPHYGDFRDLRPELDWGADGKHEPNADLAETTMPPRTALLADASLDQATAPVEKSRIERAIIAPIAFIVRTFAGCIMLSLWTLVVGPIWFALLLRTIAAFSVATVTALFTKSTPPNVERLDAVVELWVSGFQKIIVILSGTPSTSTPIIPIRASQALLETGLAIFLYAGMLSYLWLIYNFSGLAALRTRLW